MGQTPKGPVVINEKTGGGTLVQKQIGGSFDTNNGYGFLDDNGMRWPYVIVKKSDVPYFEKAKTANFTLQGVSFVNFDASAKFPLTFGNVVNIKTDATDSILILFAAVDADGNTFDCAGDAYFVYSYVE